MPKHAYGFTFEVGRIDASAGVIYGVSLATEGPALGHGCLMDRKTLEQLLASAKQYQGGLKVKMSHKGDAGDIAGFLTNLRIEGKKLLGDLNLLDSYEGRAYVLEIATKIPDTVGLSVAFSGPLETIGGLEYVRCTEIYSCDLVAEPAANPSGLFSAKTVDAPSQHIAMTPEEILTQCKALIQSSLVEFGARIKAVEDSAKTLAPTTELSAIKTQLTELSAKLDTAKTELAATFNDETKRMELAAKTVAMEFARHTGQSLRVPSDGAGAQVIDPKPAEQFIEKAVKHYSQTKSKTKALELAIAEDPKGYAAFRTAGKDIKWAA